VLQRVPQLLVRLELLDIPAAAATLLTTVLLVLAIRPRLRFALRRPAALARRRRRRGGLDAGNAALAAGLAVAGSGGGGGLLLAGRLRAAAEVLEVFGDGLGRGLQVRLRLPGPVARVVVPLPLDFQLQRAALELVTENLLDDVAGAGVSGALCDARRAALRGAGG
jgi:hypothetical protein